jgi:selenocysteine-specific translation elongation factor
MCKASILTVAPDGISFKCIQIICSVDFMPSLNIAVLGEDAENRARAAQALGKKGTADDISFYHTVFQGKIVTAVDPLAYPAKFPVLLQTLALSDIALVVADKPSPVLGEIIVALDSLGMKAVFLSPFDMKPLLALTSLKDSGIFAEIQEAREFLFAHESPRVEGSAVVYIDHCFEVKGVGTVALGIVKRGEIAVHDRITAYPSGKEIDVKSIQKNDEDVTSAVCWDRVGLAIKNATANEITRGTVLSKEKICVEERFDCELSALKFAREPLVNDEALHISAGLQFEPCRLEVGEEIKPGEKGKGTIKTEKPVAFLKEENLLLCNLNAKGLRIVGIAKATLERR